MKSRIIKHAGLPFWMLSPLFRNAGNRPTNQRRIIASLPAMGGLEPIETKRAGLKSANTP
jgi:hypothetical protein